MPTPPIDAPATEVGGTSRIAYMPYLDGLRGVAVLVVIVYHAMPHLVPGGFIGVDLFFVLSGFLITLLLLKEYEKAGRMNLKNFYMRRALRLLPALILFLTFYLLLSCVLQWNLVERSWDALLVICYSVNWTRAYEWRVPKHLEHTWSLSIEEQFYLLWPMLLLCLLRWTSSRQKLAGIIFCCALAAWFLRVILFVSGSTPERLYNGLDTRADSLLLGCALGALVSYGALPRDTKFVKRLRMIGSCAVLLLALISLYAHLWTKITLLLGFFLVPLLSLAIIGTLLTSKQSLWRIALEQPAMVWIGKLSYGLYLWHYLVFRVIRARTALSDLEVFSVGLTLSLTLASLSYYLVERPFQRLKYRFT